MLHVLYMCCTCAVHVPYMCRTCAVHVLRLLELSWLRKTYNIAECEKWVEHVKEVQAETRVIIMDQMKRRFDVVTVPYR